jgi:hypothetical protein
MDFKGIDIREVWDFRLSKGTPILYDTGKYYEVHICDNKNNSNVLLKHITSVPTINDPHDPVGPKACFEWLYTVRDQFSLDNLEIRKPVVKMINEANSKGQELTTKGLKDELKVHLENASRAIQDALQEMHDKIEELNK